MWGCEDFLVYTPSNFEDAESGEETGDVLSRCGWRCGGERVFSENCFAHVRCVILRDLKVDAAGEGSFFRFICSR